MKIEELANLIVEANEDNRIPSYHITFETEVIKNRISLYTHLEKVSCIIFDLRKFGKDYSELRITAKDKNFDLILKDELYNIEIVEFGLYRPYQITSKETTTTGKPCFKLLVFIH